MKKQEEVIRWQKTQSYAATIMCHWAHRRLRLTASLISTQWFSMDFCIERIVIKAPWTYVR